MSTSDQVPAPPGETPAGPPAQPRPSPWSRLTSAGPDGRALYQKRRFLVPLVAVLAFAFGVATGGTGADTADADSTQAALAAAQEAQQAAEGALEAAQSELATVQGQLADAEERGGEADERLAEAEAAASERVAEAQARAADAEAAARAGLEAEYVERLEELEAEAAERAAALDEREAELAEREAAVTQLEEAAEMSTFGSGVWRVGEDVLAGQYRAAEAGRGCYWARLGADGDNIIQNHFSGEAGPVVATLRDGELFETSGCGQWTRTG